MENYTAPGLAMQSERVAWIMKCIHVLVESCRRAGRPKKTWEQTRINERSDRWDKLYITMTVIYGDRVLQLVETVAPLNKVGKYMLHDIDIHFWKIEMFLQYI